MKMRDDQVATSASPPLQADCQGRVPPHFSELLRHLCETYGACAPISAATLSAELAASAMRLDPDWHLEVSVEPGFPRFRIQRRGERLSMLNANAKPGAFVENVASQHLRNHILKPYDQVVEQRAIAFSRLQPDYLRGDRSALDRLIVPCAPGDGDVSSILTIMSRVGTDDEPLAAGPQLEALREATERGRPFLCQPCDGNHRPDLTQPCAKHN